MKKDVKATNNTTTKPTSKKEEPTIIVVAPIKRKCSETRKALITSAVASIPAFVTGYYIGNDIIKTAIAVNDKEKTKKEKTKTVVKTIGKSLLNLGATYVVSKNLSDFIYDNI